MTRLSQLRPMLDSMSLDELREYVRKVREDRKITKVSKADKKVRAKRSDKSKTKVEQSLSKMTPEQLALLLGELEDGSPEGSDR